MASSTTNPVGSTDDLDLEEPVAVPTSTQPTVASTAGNAASSNGVVTTSGEEFGNEEEFDEEFGEDGQNDEFGEDEEFGDGTGGVGGTDDNFEISANEGAEYGEGFEGQEEDMIEDVRTKIREMEEEAEKLRQLQSETGAPTDADRLEVDSRSVYVGQVDYSCTTDELEAHFRPCGTINRVTIMCDKFTGHPKGFAYIEFASKESVEPAVAMNDSTLKERQLKVIPKRTNQPGMGVFRGRGRRAFRGAIYRGGRRGATAYRPYNPYYRSRSTYRGGFRGGFRRPRARYAAY